MEPSINSGQEPQSEKPFAGPIPLPGVMHVIGIASAKGGVGKTTIAVNLAVAMALRGGRVGLLDADIYGPNVPLMLGIKPETYPEPGGQGKIKPLVTCGLKMISMGVMVRPGQPLIWRGPMLHKALTEFLRNVAWGELDYLIIDLPPGTGDVALSLIHLVPLSGVVLVTTSQEMSLADVRKGIAMFRKTHTPMLGVVENMSGEIFGQGGGRKAAEEAGIPFWIEIPLAKDLRESADKGCPLVLSNAVSEAKERLAQMADKLEQTLSEAVI